MKKINVLGINVKCHNIKREEILIDIIKREVKDFYRTYKNNPYSVGDAYCVLRGKITTLYYMGLINYENYKLMNDRFYMLYKFTEEKAQSNK